MARRLVDPRILAGGDAAPRSFGRPYRTRLGRSPDFGSSRRRAEMNVPPSVMAPILLRDASPDTLARTERWSDAVRRLARASSIAPLDGAMPAGAAQIGTG